MDDDVTGLDHTDTVDDLETVTAADDTGDGRGVDERDDQLVDELLIEEISIDGMCGVY